MTERKRWRVDGRGFYFYVICRERELDEVIEAAGIPLSDIEGHRGATIGECAEHLLAGREYLVKDRKTGKVSWLRQKLDYEMAEREL